MTARDRISRIEGKYGSQNEHSKDPLINDIQFLLYAYYCMSMVGENEAGLNVLKEPATRFRIKERMRKMFEKEMRETWKEGL